EEEPQYTNESFARLSFIGGGVYVQRSSEEGFEEGIINMPIEEGNRLGTTDGRAELYLGRGAYLRLDNDTKVEVISLPKKGSNLTRLHILKGNVYLSIKRLDEEKDIEVHTPDASFYVLSEGLYRVDVQENRKTDLFVFYGVAESAGEEGSVLVKSELNLTVASGRFSGRPVRFLAVAEDAFDRWSESRESDLAIQVAAKRLPAELEDFEGELQEQGDWSWINPYGWVWVPGGLGPYWRPYYNGSWTWLSMGGWTWLPYDPWGWVTFHYGRWGWNMGLGWYWIPGTVWGPAWVSWYWGADYWAWAPLGYWNYPLAIVDNWYYPNWNRPFYPYNSRALTVIHKDQLRAKDITKAALQGDSLKGLDNKITMAVRGPALNPASGNVSSGRLSTGKSGAPQRGGEATSGSDRTIKAPAAKTPQPAIPPTTRTADKSRSPSGSTSERAIRPRGSSKAPESDRPSGSKGGSEVRKNSFGYPSSPDISIKKYSGDKRSSTSIRSRFYRYIQKSGSTSKSSSKGNTVSRGSSSSASKGSRGSVSSGSRGSSSGSRSSGSRPSGSVRKK
ncbi:MAG: FecR domain-containing protein, partial [Candidatus Aminicenantes bacterium]|nr:FecR domain-containing protein [Candidatus Aminicenantes bacterium]